MQLVIISAALVVLIIHVIEKEREAPRWLQQVVIKTGQIFASLLIMIPVVMFCI